MLAAQYKSGKSTVAHNLERALADGVDFLDHFAVNTPAQHIVHIDNELSEDMTRRWLRAQGIRNTSAIADVISLRGRVGSFDLLDDRRRAEWARRLADVGCDYLVLDCLRPILDALGLDESREAGQFLVAFDALLEEAGIANAALVHHMGHTAERSRGDSRLQDWPDVTWKLVRESESPDSDRFLSAFGRDVDVAEGRLTFTAANRHLAYAAGSRRDAKADAATLAVVDVLAADPKGWSVRGIQEALYGEHPQAAIRAGIKANVRMGVVSVERGDKGAKLHRIAYPCGKCGRPVITQKEVHESCR